MKIRKMMRQDEPEVLAMMRVFYDSPAVLYKAPDVVLQRDVRDCVGDCPYIEGYIFEENGMAQGYAMVAKSYSTEYGGLCIWIEDLYMKPECRGKGIGTAFFQFLHETYDGVAVRYRLEVEPENSSAIGVYKKSGYQELPYCQMTRETSFDSREYFDICNSRGLPVGRVVDRETAHRQGVCHRTAHVWFVRVGEKGAELLLQRRSMEKDSFPGCLDTSSAGHIPAGSEPVESALRELEEELGFSASREDLELIGQFENRYEKIFHGALFKDYEIANVYVCHKPVDISALRLQKEELDSVGWYDLQETYERCRQQDPDYCVPVASLDLLKRYLEQEGLGC